MGQSRNHENTPDGFSVCDVIPNLATVNFTLANNLPFCIDNENDAPVTLSVKFASMTTFVSKVFQVGPNPYLLKEIKAVPTAFPSPVNAAFTNAIGSLTDGTYYYRVSAIIAAGETLASTETSLAIAKLATPVNAAFTSGAGTLGIGTYYYRVAAINAIGETLASTETSLALVAAGGVNVNWGTVTGATGYKIYGRTTGAELLIATVGAVTTYLDGGSITPAGALPVADTTAGGINVNWGVVAGATGYKVYGRSSGAELLIATIGSVLTYLDGGSITPAGALPVANTTAPQIALLKYGY